MIDIHEFIRFSFFVVFTLTVNHEPDAKLFKDPVQELLSNSRKSVAVHDNNFSDHSFVDEFQKGLEYFAIEVNTRPNVCEDPVVLWVGCDEIVPLTSQIFLLL